MIRNLKPLGVALAVVFTMSAVSASAAQAEIFFHSEAENTTLVGSQAETHEFATAVGTFTCKTMTSSGTMNGTAALEIVLESTYTECHLKNGGQLFNVTIHTNGCTNGFVPSGGTFPKYAGYMNLECPEK